MFKEYFENENSLFSTVPTWMKADFISPLWRQNFFRPMRMATGCDPPLQQKIQMDSEQASEIRSKRAKIRLYEHLPAFSES